MSQKKLTKNYLKFTETISMMDMKKIKTKYNDNDASASLVFISVIDNPK